MLESLVKFGAVLPVLKNKAFFQFKLVCMNWVEDRNELGEASAFHLGLLSRRHFQEVLSYSVTPRPLGAKQIRILVYNM